MNIDKFIAETEIQIKKRIGAQYYIKSIQTNEEIKVMICDSYIPYSLALTYIIIDLKTLNIYDTTRKRIHGNPYIQFGIININN